MLGLYGHPVAIKTIILVVHFCLLFCSSVCSICSYCVKVLNLIFKGEHFRLKLEEHKRSLNLEYSLLPLPNVLFIFLPLQKLIHFSIEMQFFIYAMPPISMIVRYINQSITSDSCKQFLRTYT